MPTREVCDRCGVPASNVFKNPDSRTLVMCNHHANEYYDGLTRDGFWLVEDPALIR